MLEMRWLFGTRSHDWRKLATVRRVFGRLLELDVVTQVQWLEEGTRDRTEFRSSPAGLCDFAVDRIREQGSVTVSAGSARPFGWQASLAVPPHDDEGRPESMSVASVRFFLDPSDADAVKDAFRETHEGCNTEYASIHPYQDWADLVEGPYRVPVTFAPFFEGVLWANFLGPGHLGEFEFSQVLPLDVVYERYEEGERLVFIVTDDVEDTCSRLGIDTLLALTERFRAARRRG